MDPDRMEEEEDDDEAVGSVVELELGVKFRLVLVAIDPEEDEERSFSPSASVS